MSEIKTIKDLQERFINHAEANDDGLYLNFYEPDENGEFSILSRYIKGNSGRCYHLTHESGKPLPIKRDMFGELYALCKYRVDYGNVVKIPDGKTDTDFYYPTCIYCGQARLPETEFLTQKDADEYATICCSCDRAKVYQYEAKRAAELEANKKKIKENIEHIAAYCANRNSPMTLDIKSLVNQSAVAVLNGFIKDAAFKFGFISAKITRAPKGYIKFNFTYNDSQQTEI